MSDSFGLVRFKSTGNIYYCCYGGTFDVLIPYICTPEECYDEQIDCYCAITYCRDLYNRLPGPSFLGEVSDLDDVEIYVDYGGGFYWDGTGSESFKMIKDSLEPWDDPRVKIKDGMPEWARKFLESR